ncbi:glycine oxidase ThiO [Fictibacillus sp. WQ 8-8]|uniref:glycine oxidase ThiO n=1 Tax=Fictibacillus sp. WQ 8-8 TaxID=2938788 RepID=UPI00210B50C2|nr:glycine oxidase ThiO [Fictibacillus sp. WQ 8-8]MCQ6266891.1 glycine oxidase ThiO [Fictibacillus sp. WQ 8-8]
MPRHYDVIIAGGGIIGCAIAYYLRKHTEYTVLVIEKNRIGSEASSAAAGMLGAQAELNEAGPLYTMARESRSLFPELNRELKEISGIDIEFIDKGLFKAAKNEKESLRLQQLIDFHNDNGQPAEWISGSELLKMEPKLSSGLEGAMYLPKDGQVNPSQLTKAFAQSAAMLGADFLDYTEAAGFEMGRSGIGIQTSAGMFFGEKAVLASGVWTGKLAAQTGLHMPLFPVKGECLSLTFLEPVITSTVISDECYLVPKQGGRLVIGATMEAGTYDRKVRAKGVLELLTKASEVLPAIEEGEWEKAWTGFRPQTPDGLPYMGKHPYHKDLYIAAGHFRNGILLSPLTGRWMAELLIGDLQEERLKEFAPDRFAYKKMKG